MTDLERIQFIEEAFGFKLKQVDASEIGRKDFYTVNISYYPSSYVRSPSFPYQGSRNYGVNEGGNIVGLSLDFSPLFMLPAHFLKYFRSLEFLSLRSSGISDFSFLKELKGLTSLDLSNNRIKEIPDWLAGKGLEIRIGSEYAPNCFNLYGNPIEKPPMEVVKQGNKAILNYYAQLEDQGRDYLYEAKMLIVGEGGAGKTTLAHKMQDDDCPLPHIDDRTRSITIKTHAFTTMDKDNAEDHTFKLNVWDFGGQAIYHATHRFFLSRRSLYVLVADNRKDDTDFNYWLNIIELYAGESPIIIVLNEKDDVQRGINKAELRRCYPESIKEIIPVNFKTREEENTETRRQRLKKVSKLNSHIKHQAVSLPHIGEPLPALWIKVREAIENEDRNYIYREHFDDICRRLEITNEHDIDTLLGYFHDLGVVLHFKGNPLLSNLIFLKPFWATNAVYRIFDNEVVKAKKGRFTRDNCAALWSGAEYHHMHDALVELMKNFRLVYEIGNTGNLVAPQMLPRDTPDHGQVSSDNSLMQFRYDLFMPKGIFWQFVVEMYRYIENHSWVWCNGAVLHRDGTRAEVIENLSERRIYICIFGPEIAEFRAIITDTLDEISNSYHKLKYEKMIPCNCGICIKKNSPHFFKYSILKKRLNEGKKHTIECEISTEDVPVLPLLEGFNIARRKDIFECISKTDGPKQKTEVKTVKIFLASSSEFADDRKEFEIFIYRKNNEYKKDRVFLELTLWEDFLDSMSQTRLQDEYNKAAEGCDVFVSLFHTKAGKYTKEEFEIALKTFKDNGRPLIYTYFKDEAVKPSKIAPDFTSLLDFKKKLKDDLGHFPTDYADINDLKYKFGEQIPKFLLKLTGG